jgi:hypothetical protein
MADGKGTYSSSACGWKKANDQDGHLEVSRVE